ncbi:hypothetical protein HPB48_017915 [Haemaphysalis longicornis]|uniref:Flotillin n=1 Tax=Haemaphysalis longicornis TaxID=44386 RepID=A0A9J6GP72_HAELO|nr:hypothetical protein HPB48_017915 [Haemaphysalis longicornis]
MDVKYGANTKIEDSHRMYQLQKANFDGEVNSRKAEAQLAYELQAAKMKQKIRNEEIEIDVVERRKQISVEEKEILRREKELTATIRLPAEAEAYRVEMVAQGKSSPLLARAGRRRWRWPGPRQSASRWPGAAEGYAIEAVGKADAERMRMKAAAYKQFGDAAILSLVLDTLPKIAAEVSAPLAKTEEIVMVSGDDRTVAEVTKLVSQIPPTVQALTGVDLTKCLLRLKTPSLCGEEERDAIQS